MRVLEFEVKQQRLRKQPGCDFSHIVAGSSGYLRAKFNFSPEWDECIKAVTFFYENDESENSYRLDENDSCFIPAEVLGGESFGVCVTGARHSDNKPGRPYVIQSNRMDVKQEVI